MAKLPTWLRSDARGSLGHRAKDAVSPVVNGAHTEVVTQLLTDGGTGDALGRMAEAEDTLRAIGAGEVDAFVVSDSGSRHRVFTLTTADRPYRMFVESMRDGAATVSDGGLILYANRRLGELLGRPASEVSGLHLSSVIDGPVPVGLLGRPDGPTSKTNAELVLAADGRAVPVLVGASPLDMDGEYVTCLTFTDLTAQKAQEREIARLSAAQHDRLMELQGSQASLTEQATHDALTGLPNRALLVDRIEQALSQAQRSGRCTAVLFVDLDGFKQVNDTKGHAAGDVELRRVAERLVSVMRSMDTVARLGGDEFVILAPEVDSRMHALDMSERLIKQLSARLPDGGESMAASIGLAVSVSGSGTAEDLLHEADTAMYHAKSLGGERVAVFDVAFAVHAQERASTQVMLRSALDEARVMSYFQPIVNLPGTTVAGFEALARITKQDGAILSPAAFIPTAEDCGLVVPLGTRVLELACEEAMRWKASAGRRLTVAVNLSARQFESGALPEVVASVLTRTGLEASALHLELTETAVIDLRPEILEQLQKVRDLGVEIGLDDFGTGYASLTHLRRLPLTFVKLDGTFVRGLGTDREDERIVAAVVDLAANLGLRSVAEGVETAQQLEHLCNFECNQAQGYLFARPADASQIPRYLSDSMMRAG